jgi:hypothetical protein
MYVHVEFRVLLVMTMQDIIFWVSANMVPQQFHNEHCLFFRESDSNLGSFRNSLFLQPPWSSAPPTALVTPTHSPLYYVTPTIICYATIPSLDPLFCPYWLSLKSLYRHWPVFYWLCHSFFQVWTGLYQAGLLTCGSLSLQLPSCLG